MRKNRRRNSVQIVIVTFCVCFAIAVLGYILDVKLDELRTEVASEAKIGGVENINVNALSATKTILTLSSNFGDVENLVDDVVEKSDGVSGKADEVIGKVTDKVDKILTSDTLPLLTGLATGLMTVLALIVPYIKTLGKLKSTQSAYATVYDEHEKLIGLAKEFDTENVKKDIIEKVIEEVESKFVRYDKALGQVLGQEEIISAQITSLIEGAKLAWKQADGASVILAKTPTATVVEKQALAIEFLKTMIATELGLKKEELETKMNKELAK